MHLSLSPVVCFLGARRRNVKGGSGLVGILHLRVLSTKKLGSVLV